MNKNLKNILTRDFLEKEYIGNKKSYNRISKENNCTKTTVSRYLRKYNIKVRSDSEAVRLFYVNNTHPNKGKTNIYSQETIERMSKSLRGKTPWNKGKSHSEETRRKISEAKKGGIPWNKGTKGLQNSNKKGKDHVWYKHGLSGTKEYQKMFVSLRRTDKTGILTVKNIQAVYEKNIKEFETLTCVYCFKNVEFGKDSLEHIIPLSRGGTNKFENLAVACMRCNCSKNNKLLKEWIK